MKRIITRTLSLALMLMLLLQCLSAVACNVRYNKAESPKNDSVQSSDESKPSLTPLASGQTENGLSWVISDSGTLTISGSGIMPDYAYNTMPWYGNAAKVNKLVIAEGVQNIGRCAFYGFNGITEVTLPKTMTVIGEYAFFGCSALKKIAIPENVYSIGAYAFRKSGVTAFEFAKTNGWTADGSEVDVTLATNLTSTCYKMTFTRTETDEATEEILAGGFRFRLNEDGKSYELLGPSGYLGDALLIYGSLNGKPVTSIAPEAFKDCTAFTSLVIDERVTAIGDSAFSGCNELRIVMLPASLREIGNDVFDTETEDIYFFFEEGASPDSLTVGEGNAAFNESTVYYYSAEQPTENGNFWVYQDGEIAIWDTAAEQPPVPDTPPQNTETVNVFYYVALESDIIGSNESSGTVNSAVYEKNLTVEAQRNVKFNFIPSESIYWNDFGSEMLNRFHAAEEIDVIFAQSNSLIQNKIFSTYFYDYASSEALKLDQPWWNEKAMNELSVDNQNRAFLIGDITASSYVSKCGAIFYNKYLAERLFPAYSFYESVNNKSWTLDEFYRISKMCYSDRNGNAVKDDDDYYAFQLFRHAEPIHYFANSVGIEYYSRNSNGTPRITLNSAKSISFTQKLYSLIYENPSADLYYPNMIGEELNHPCDFEDGRILFKLGVLGDAMGEYMTAMEDAYGVLPYPLWDSEQENYITFVNHSSVLTVTPYYIDTVRAETVIAPLLEAMAKEGYNKVTPVFFDKILKGGYSRETDDAAMLDLIVATSTKNFIYEYGSSLYNIGSIFSTLMANKSTNFASRYASIEGAAKTMLTQLTNDILAGKI